MENLKESFIGTGSVKGFRFNQIKRTEKVALYSVECSGPYPHYEVFLIFSSGQLVMLDGKRHSNADIRHEIYPKDEKFGVTAWTFNSLEHAERRYELLNDDCNVFHPLPT